MGKIIAVANQKGGVGKTTTCVNLCCALHELGQKILLCDFDPQGNATSGFGVNKSVSPNVYDVIMGGTEPKKAIVSTKFGDVMPANKTLSGADVELSTAENREHRLKNALETLRQEYDYIIIDCPPSLGLLTLNGLCAADSILIPVQCEYYALEGLSDLMYTIRLVKKRLNTELDIEGVVLTMFDSRTNLSMQVADEVKRHFPGKLFKSVIPRNVRLSEAPSHGKPVQHYDRGSRGAETYSELGTELLKRNGGSK